MTIIWCMVPEIRNTTDIIFSHSRPFLALLATHPPTPMDPENQTFFKNGKKTWRYYYFTNINDSHMMYGSPDMECNRQKFLSFWTILCPFTPKSQNFEKMKKLPGDIFILHRCNINDNHVMHGSWDTKCNRQNFLSFWTIFCTFTPNNPKNQNFEKMKKPSINDNHMMHGSWYWAQ